MSAPNPLSPAAGPSTVSRAAYFDEQRVSTLHPRAAAKAEHHARISVVVVSYNAGNFLDECVRAVLSSTLPVQLLICDNASDDGSMERLERAFGNDERLLILRNSENLGFAKASNRAIRHATADLVALLNPDCFVSPDTLERLCRAMAANPKAGMAGCMVRNPDGSEQAGTRRAIPTPWRTLVRVFHLDRVFPRHPRFRNFVVKDEPLPQRTVRAEGISGALMLVRREALDEVGLLDEGYFLHCEDLDWFMRFRANAWEILFVPDVDVVHLKGGCSTRHPLRVLWHKHRGMVRFYRKFFRHQYPRVLMWSVATAVWARFSVLTIATVVCRGATQARDWMTSLRHAA